MKSPRERQLAEGINNKLIAIQKAEQIYDKLSKWEKKVVLMSEKEVIKVAVTTAARIEQYACSVEKKTGAPPTFEQVMGAIRTELESV